MTAPEITRFVFDPSAGEPVLEPEDAGPGFWVGCPSALVDAGHILLTYRRRRPRGHPGGDRGWYGAVATSTDGRHVEDIWSVTSAQLSSPSMERFCLHLTGDAVYQLYLSYVDPVDNRWRIDVVEAGSPDSFDVDTRRPVFTAASTGTEGVKDPKVIRLADGRLVMVISAAQANLTEDLRRTAHAAADVYNTGLARSVTALAESSDDGTTWRWQGIILGPGRGWDRWASRITTILNAPDGYWAYYDGESDHRHNYEEKAGLAFSTDLLTWDRLTPDAPALSVSTGSGSVRYIDAVTVGGDPGTPVRRLYYEMARRDGSHDLRTILVGDPR